MPDRLAVPGEPRRPVGQEPLEVCVAHAARDEADEHLTGFRLGEIELLDLERLAEPLEHRGADLHGAILRISGRGRTWRCLVHVVTLMEESDIGSITPVETGSGRQ